MQTKPVILAALILLASTAMGTLPPGTYEGFYENFEDASFPPTASWYTYVGGGGASLENGEFHYSTGQSARFTLAAVAGGSWSVSVELGTDLACSPTETQDSGSGIQFNDASNVLIPSASGLMRLNCNVDPEPDRFEFDGSAAGGICDQLGGAPEHVYPGIYTFSWDTTTDMFTIEGVCTVDWSGDAVTAAKYDNMKNIAVSPGTCDSAIAECWWDDLVVLVPASAGFFFTITEGPTTPAGLSGLITQVQGGGGSLTELRWPVSSNDPDQVQGDYTYQIFLNGVNVGNDATTAEDGDGQRFNVVNFVNGAGASTLTFQVRAYNATSGATSNLSCSISLDDGVLNDFDVCGTDPPGGAPGGTDFTTPTDTGAGLLGFCSDLMGDSDASLFLCGLIFVVAAFLAMAGGFAAITGSTGLGPTIAGSMAGFGMAIFNVFAGIWGIVWAIVLIVLVAAIITVVVKKFVGAGASSGE